MDLSDMTDRREALQATLQNYRDAPVYYEPPENIRMSYPCFVLKLNEVKTTYANGSIYLVNVEYSLTYITRSVTDDIIADVLHMIDYEHYVRFDRVYTSDNLRHYVFDVTLV